MTASPNLETKNTQYVLDTAELIPEGLKCECGCGEFTKETDTMDVWNLLLL